MTRVLVTIGVLAALGAWPGGAQTQETCMPSALNIHDAQYPCLLLHHSPARIAAEHGLSVIQALPHAIEEALSAEMETLVAVVPASDRDRRETVGSQVAAAADREPQPRT